MHRYQQKINPAVISILVGAVGTIFLGNIAIIELVALVWLFIVGGHKKLPSLFRRDSSYVGFFFLTALGLFVSDLVNSSSLDVTLKGFGAYFVFPITVLFLVSLFSVNQLWLVLLSSTIVQLFTNKYIAELGFGQETFKFGFAFALVYLILSAGLLLYRFGLRYNAMRLLTFLSALSIVFLGMWGNLRLLALCSVISLVIDQTCSLPRLRNFILFTPSKLTRLIFFSLAFPFMLVAVSIALTLLISLLINIFPFEFISQDALKKTLSQSSGQLGIIFGGRTEIFSSYLAWIEKPFLGWGSWASDPNYTFNLAGKILMNDFGYELDIDEISNFIERVETSGLIPTHSALLNALVWAGMIGFVPLYVSFCQNVINLLESGALKAGYSYPFTFAYVLYLWYLLFSPFGYTNRLSSALLLAIGLTNFVSLKNRFISARK